MSHGTKFVYEIRRDYSSNNVTTTTWVQLVASLPSDVRELEIFDSSGQTMQLAYGPAGSETSFGKIFQGGNGRIASLLNKGMAISIKAISGNATVGELDINFYR